MIQSQRIAIMCLLGFVALLQTGCGYTLRGKVVQGQTSSVEMVHEMDPRLKGPGLANVEAIVRRDPKSSAPQLVGRERTDAEGNFSMSIKEFGAGWMQEQWLVQARSSGFQNASTVMPLPAKGSKWRLLITLAPGESTPLDVQEQIIEDLERFQ